MPRSLAGSYAYCERLARREAGNFYYAFCILPPAQRRAMCALYAFLRLTDDVSDGPGATEEKRRRLDEWRFRFQGALGDSFSHACHPALLDIVNTYEIPREYFDAVLDGVGMDLAETRFDTFADLYRYCYHVASAVGLACIHIWGFAHPDAKKHAEQAGIAFQLTNILRDLREDAARGRIYLPREDLDRFGYEPDRLARGERDECFRALMRFEVDRARSYYDASRPLLPLLPPAGRAVFQVMSRTYRGVLEAIERRDFDVFSARVQLSTWKKIGFAVQALPVRWGVLA
jgi:phytoene synthase